MSGTSIEWCVEPLGVLLSTHLEMITLDASNESDLRGYLLPASDDSNALVVCHTPSTALLQIVRESNLPALLIYSSPAECLHRLVSKVGRSAEPAIRLLTQSYSAISETIDWPDILRFNIADLTPNQFVQSVAQALGAAPSEQELVSASKLVEMSQANLPLLSDETDAMWKPAMCMLECYEKLLHRGSYPEIVWPRSLFRLADDHREHAIRPVELTGRARCLIFGPYLSLPAGTWIAKMAIALSEDALGATFIADVCTETVLGQIEIKPEKSGPVMLQVPFVIDDPLAPVEVRLFIKFACFEGRLAFGGVVIEASDE